MRVITKDSEALLGRASENGRPQTVYSGCGPAIDGPKDVVDHLAILKTLDKTKSAPPLVPLVHVCRRRLGRAQISQQHGMKTAGKTLIRR